MSADLATQTPIQIDTALATLYGQRLNALLRVERAESSLHYAVGDRKSYGRRAVWGMTLDQAEAVAADRAQNDTTYVGRDAEKALVALSSARETLAEIDAQMQTLEAEFTRRGGWTRAFLVTNGNGHVHSSMDCSTCNRGQSATQFQWMVDFSDLPEEEIVEAAGWRACTLCYPSAPVGDENSLPTKMFSEQDKAKDQARVEREEKKAAALAKKIASGLTEDGSEFEVVYCETNAPGWERDEQGNRVHVYRDRDRDRTERFKTERTAVMWVVETLADARSAWAGEYTTQRAEDRKPAIEAILDAVAAKHGKTREDVDAEIEKKVAAKVKRG